VTLRQQRPRPCYTGTRPVRRLFGHARRASSRKKLCSRGSPRARGRKPAESPLGRSL
jgi:hypothetical protein